MISLKDIKNNIVRRWKLYKIRVKLALKGLTFKVFLIWTFAWLPIFLIYKLTGLVIMLHDYSAEVCNKLDDYMITKLK
jgi:hypothetical protein